MPKIDGARKNYLTAKIWQLWKVWTAWVISKVGEFDRPGERSPE